MIRAIHSRAPVRAGSVARHLEAEAAIEEDAVPRP
jgi:hypothetical protein